MNEGTTPFESRRIAPARADVDRDDVQQHVAVDRRRFELDVVHTNDLAAVDVDDLLIEQIALEQQDAVRRSVATPMRSIPSSMRTVLPHDLTSSAGSARSPSERLDD